MWMQIITGRIKPGTEAQLADVGKRLQALEQPGSGLIRNITARSQQDPSTVYTVVTFESEEAARTREADPRRQEGLAELRTTLAQIFDGPLEFVDLEVISDYSGS